jgi:hypothetical protein
MQQLPAQTKREASQVRLTIITISNSRKRPHLQLALPNEMCSMGKERIQDPELIS